MRIIGLSQGSPEWHIWRKAGLGSSDAPVLLGVSPWKTIEQLFLEKIGEVTSMKHTWATLRGNRLEPKVLGMYNRSHGECLTPATAVHDEHHYLKASFDGVNPLTRRLIEIKCPGEKSHSKALNGEVPDIYIPQVQWLLMVSGYPTLDYLSWNGKTESPVSICVQADPLIQSELLRKADLFWGFLLDHQKKYGRQLEHNSV